MRNGPDMPLTSSMVKQYVDAYWAKLDAEDLTNMGDPMDNILDDMEI